MPSKRVWVELAPCCTGSLDVHAIRIFKNSKAAFSSSAWADCRVVLADRAIATKDIRAAVFQRDGYACTHCGKAVTWETGHLHERVWRGRGGEMSLDNSTTLCVSCHLNDPVAGHGKRQPQFIKERI